MNRQPRDAATSARRPIAVVGAGVVGLSAAIVLRRHGWPVTIFAERRTPGTTSDRAGAVFSPFRLEEHPRTEQWTRTSYRVFRELAEEAGPAAGLSLGPLREFFFRRLDGRPWWTQLLESYRRIDAPPPPYADGVAVVVPRMDMRRYMPWLERRFTAELGGEIVTARIERVEDLFDRGFAVVVNCAGLGSGALASDPAVMPMRGQVLHVPPLPGLSDCLVEESRGAQTTYVFPFDDYMVLGGTYERGLADEATDPAALAGIVARCRAMLEACGYRNVGTLGERPMRTLAGLRPARVIGECDEAVRLECEEVSAGRSVIHNYGHGRVGVTLSWGCAEDVADLVRNSPGA